MIDIDKKRVRDWNQKQLKSCHIGDGGGPLGCEAIGGPQFAHTHKGNSNCVILLLSSFYCEDLVIVKI